MKLTWCVIILPSALSVLCSAQTVYPCNGRPPICSIIWHRHRCNAKGKLLMPTSLQDSPVQTYGASGNSSSGDCIAHSYVQCRDACLSTGPRCRTFGFDKSSGLCTFSTKILQNQGFVPDPESATTYSNSECFTAQYYKGDGLQFLGLSGTGATATATDISSNTTIQPAATAMFANTATDRCDAANSCVEYVSSQSFAGVVKLNVAYLLEQQEWQCVAWVSEDEIALSYTPDTTIGEYYAFGDPQQE